MYICICKQVTDKQIQSAIENGANTVNAIQQQLGASSECGGCLDCVKDMIAEFFVPANSIRTINSANLKKNGGLATNYSQL